MVEDSDSNRQNAVVVLVTEDFFCDRICTTLTALGREAVRPSVDDGLLDTVLGTGSLGVVVDLEDDQFDALELLQKLREAPQTSDWTFLSFCSYDDEERMAKATALGLSVTPRSTFALNLVRKLQEFGVDEDANS
ncbi:MAG: hypothetical protein ACPG31_10600 [Planctomycetota bacterium]